MYHNPLLEDVRNSLQNTTVCTRCRAQVLEILASVDTTAVPVGLNGLRRMSSRPFSVTSIVSPAPSDEPSPNRMSAEEEEEEEAVEIAVQEGSQMTETLKTVDGSTSDLLAGDELMRVVQSFNNVDLKYHRQSIDFWSSKDGSGSGPHTKLKEGEATPPVTELVADVLASALDGKRHGELDEGGEPPNGIPKKERKSVAFDDETVEKGDREDGKPSFDAQARRRRSTKRQSLSLDLLVRLNSRRHVQLEDSMLAASTGDSAEVVHKDEVSKGEDEFGCKLINDYVVVSDLGRGAFGKVKLCMHKETNEPVAVKVLKKSFLKRAAKPGGLSAMQTAQHEIAIMKKLRHASIVRLYEVVDDPKFDKMYLIMQYIEGGKITDISPEGICEPIDDPRRVLSIIRQLSSALSYLHSQEIVHRDIKPDNILKDKNGRVYLSDFGGSTLMGDRVGSDKVMENPTGTVPFFAPEMCVEQKAQEKPIEVDGFACDVWALGITLYCLAYGRLPFFGKDVKEIFEEIRSKELTFPPQGFVPCSESDDDTKHWQWVADIISNMLEKSPSNRMSLSELRAHPALKKSEVTSPKLRRVETKFCESMFMFPIDPTVTDVYNAIAPFERDGSPFASGDEESPTATQPM